MRALLVLAVVPVLIGVVAARFSGDVRRASVLAILACVAFVFIATQVTDSDFAVGWLATLLVLPLPVACAVATVAYFAGRHHGRHDGA